MFLVSTLLCTEEEIAILGNASPSSELNARQVKEQMMDEQAKEQRRIEIKLSDDHLRATVEIPGTTPAEVVAAFCEADRVRQWWGGDLMADPRESGAYVVHFPQLGQTMRGEVREYSPGRLLAFTWAWDHEPDAPYSIVIVRADLTPEGARLEVEHGPYTDATRADAVSHK